MARDRRDLLSTEQTGRRCFTNVGPWDLRGGAARRTYGAGLGSRNLSAPRDATVTTVNRDISNTLGTLYAPTAVIFFVRDPGRPNANEMKINVH